MTTIGELPNGADLDPADLLEIQRVDQSMFVHASAMGAAVGVGAPFQMYNVQLTWGEGGRVIYTFPEPFVSTPRIIVTPQYAGFTMPVITPYIVTTTTLELIGYQLTESATTLIPAGTSRNLVIVAFGEVV